jgi:hypothetical protein
MALGVFTARGHTMALDRIIVEIDKETDQDVIHKSFTPIEKVRIIQKRTLTNRPLPVHPF